MLVMQPAGHSRNEKPNRRQVNHGESLMRDRAATGGSGRRSRWDIPRVTYLERGRLVPVAPDCPCGARLMRISLR